MNIFKRSLILFSLILLIASSCSTSKSTSTTDTKVDTIFMTKIEHDTVKIYKEKIVVPSTSTSISINPIDEDGNLKPTNIKIKNKYVTVYVKDTLGELKFNIKVDSLVQSQELIYEAKYKEKLEKYISEHNKELVSKKVTTKWSKWTYIFLGIDIFLFLLLISRFRNLIPVILF